MQNSEYSFGKIDANTAENEPPTVWSFGSQLRLEYGPYRSQFRSGAISVLVGVNLLREGLDLPEVSLVAVLDADKEGFLRSTTSLVQTKERIEHWISGRIELDADIELFTSFPKKHFRKFWNSTNFADF